MEHGHLFDEGYGHWLHEFSDDVMPHEHQEFANKDEVPMVTQSDDSEGTDSDHMEQFDDDAAERPRASTWRFDALSEAEQLVTQQVVDDLVAGDVWITTCSTSWFRKSVEYYRFVLSDSGKSLSCRMEGTGKQWKLKPAAYNGSWPTEAPHVMFRESEEDLKRRAPEDRLAFWLSPTSSSLVPSLQVGWIDSEGPQGLLRRERPGCTAGSDRAALLVGGAR